MTKLNDRQRTLLKRLYTALAPLSTDDLCGFFDVSLRTIRYDLATIKDVLQEHHISLVVKNGTGYSISNRDKPKLLALLDHLGTVIGDAEKEARNTMILLTLLTQNHPATLSQYTHLMYLSDSAISKLIQDLNNDLSNFSLSIESTHHGYHLLGKEHAKRLLLAQIIFSAINKHYNLLDYYEVLPKQITRLITVDRFKLMTLIIDHGYKPYEVWLSQNSYTLLLSYLITVDVRKQLGMKEDYSSGYDPGVFESEKQYSCFLFNHLFPKMVSHEEINGFISFLVSHGIFVLTETGASTKSSHALVVEILRYLKEKQLPLDYDTLFKDLSEHIAISMKHQRLEKIPIVNPLLNQIKYQHSEQYTLAQSINDEVIRISEHTYDVSEDELSYIAIYLYKNWLKKPEIQYPRVYVACASSRGVSKLLETRIKHVFPQIEVLGSLTINQIMHKHYTDKADFIISTLPVQNSNIPVLHVTPVLNVKDIEMIQKMMNYGITARIIPNVSKFNVNAFVEKQFESLEANTMISIEKLSVVILTLLDTMLSMDEKYQVSDQKILGILIHLILAIPRWITASDDHDSFAHKALMSLKSSDTALYVQLADIFDVIERELEIILSDQERLSFFDYIIERDFLNEKTDIQ